MELSVFYDHIVEAAAQTGKPVDEVCKIVRSFGITAVEIENRYILADRVGVLRSLENADLHINCINGYFDFTHHPDEAQGRAFIDFASELGAKKVLVIPGFIGEGEEKGPLMQNLQGALTALCAYAGERGVTVGVEDYDDYIAPFSTIDQLDWLMHNVPGLHCTFDTGNFLYNEEDVLQAFDKLKSKVNHLHCKDRSFTPNPDEKPKLTTGGRKMYSIPVGSGVIPIRQIITALYSQGYTGSFAIEHFGSPDQLGFMKKSAEWMLSLEKELSR